MEIVEVSGQLRTDLGKSGAKKAREAEQIPCVLYGGGEVVHFSTTFNDVRHLIYTPDFKMASVTVDGKSYRALIRDVQFHPVSDEILHIDFLQLTEGRKVTVELPVRFRGLSPGVKNGGRLVQQLRRVKVKALPKKLLNEMTIDISTLEMGDTIRVRDIDTEEGIEIVNQPSIPVASVLVPRALKSLTTAVEGEEGELAEEGEGAEATEGAGEAGEE